MVYLHLRFIGSWGTFVLKERNSYRSCRKVMFSRVCVCSHGEGGLWQRPPCDKVPPGQRPHWTETPLDRDPSGQKPLWTMTPFRWADTPPPSRTETLPDRDPPYTHTHTHTPQRVVRILLECILVKNEFSTAHVIAIAMVPLIAEVNGPLVP